MKNLSIMLVVLLATAANAYSQTCADKGKEIKPQLSDEVVRDYEAKRLEARKAAVANPDNADALIWLGRRTAYLGNYKDSIRIFTVAMEKFPDDARLYRHRGHRYITLRCFDDAAKDLEKAADLISGKPDEVEPDGLPNAKNIPTSTLQSNIWYHLGLAYYLKGDLKKALRAYQECMKVSKNPDMMVATTHWLYMTLRRMKDENRAAAELARVGDDLEIIENADYYKLIKLYKGTLKAEDLEREMGADASTLGSASLGYGLGNWYLYSGRKPEAEKIFKKIVAGNQWASFGYIAAEDEVGPVKP